MGGAFEAPGHAAGRLHRLAQHDRELQSAGFNSSPYARGVA
jgi:hypothetical protein